MATVTQPVGAQGTSTAAPQATRKRTPALTWMLAAIVMFVVCVPLAIGIVITSALALTSPPAWAGIAMLMAVGYYVFVLMMLPIAGGGLTMLYVILSLPLILMVVGLLMGFMKQKKVAGVLALVSGILFLPIGILAILGAVAYLREAKEAAAAATATPTA